MTIHEALAAVMEDLTSVAKKDRNEHQRFLFRGIDAVVNAVGPILRKHQVIVVPELETVSYDTVQTSTGKAASACRVVVSYRFYATDGSSIVTRVAAEAWDHGDKAAPKAMSVAFRTALLQSLALPTDDPDPDASSYEQQTPAKAPATKKMSRPKPADADPNAVTPAQVTKIAAAMSEAGITQREDALKYVNDVIGREVASRNELSKAEASKVIEALQHDLEQPFPVAPEEVHA